MTTFSLPHYRTSHSPIASRWPQAQRRRMMGLFAYFRFQNLVESWDSIFGCVHFTTRSPLKILISSCLNLYQHFFCLAAILQEKKQSSIWQCSSLRNLCSDNNIYLLDTYYNTMLLFCIDHRNKIFSTSFAQINLWCQKMIQIFYPNEQCDVIYDWNDNFQQ